jgi:hypothetical protein
MAFPLLHMRIDHGKVDAIDQYATAFWNVEALDELGHRALPEPEGPTMPMT